MAQIGGPRCGQGDSTWFIERCLARSLSGVAISSICDPQAAALCHAAGEGAELQLRFGGKTAPEADSGPPIDALVKVSTPTTQCPLAVAAVHVAAPTCLTWRALGLMHLVCWTATTPAQAVLSDRLST